MEDQIAVARWKIMTALFGIFHFEILWTGNLWKRHPTWIQTGAFVVIVVVCNLSSRQSSGLLSGDGHMEGLQPPSPWSKVAKLTKFEQFAEIYFSCLSLQIIQTVLSSLVEYQVFFLEKNYRYKNLFDSFSNLTYTIFHMEYEIMTRHTKRIQIVANSCPCE